MDRDAIYRKPLYELDLNALVDLCAKLPATVPPIPNIGIGPRLTCGVDPAVYRPFARRR